MSRILYVSQYFVRDDQPGGVRHWQHARALAQAGHEVEVVTSYVQHKEREVPERYRGRRVVREEEDGLVVWRTYATPGYGRDLRSRVSNYGTFAWWSTVAGARAKRPDVVVASSPSLPAAATAAAVAGARGARFLLEVRDLWPDSAVAMGLVSDPRIIGAAQRLERFCYSKAERVVALTEGIRDGVVAGGVPPARVELITNGVDLNMTDGAEPASEVPGRDAGFVAMYVGAHGTYNALGGVLAAADRLRGESIQIVLVGGGDRKDALVAEAEERGLDNVTFCDPVPKRDVPRWLAAADACILPYQDLELFSGALPNKTFDYMAAARPLVASVPPGELTRLVQRAGCGVSVPAEDPDALAGALRALATDPVGAREMGRRGSDHARRHYDRAVLAERFVRTVESLA